MNSCLRPTSKSLFGALVRVDWYPRLKLGRCFKAIKLRNDYLITSHIHRFGFFTTICVVMINKLSSNVGTAYVPFLFIDNQ